MHKSIVMSLSFRLFACRALTLTVLTASGKHPSIGWCLRGIYQYRGTNSNILRVPKSDFASDVE
jgi:hypothetical protein